MSEIPLTAATKPKEETVEELINRHHPGCKTVPKDRLPNWSRADRRKAAAKARKGGKVSSRVRRKRKRPC